MINCCRIFLTASQIPAVCRQSDICCYNSVAMIKVVLDFQRLQAVKANLTILWVTYRYVLEGKTLSMFQLISCAGFSFLHIYISLKYTYKRCLHVRVRCLGELGVPVPSPFSYFGFHWKEALLHLLGGTITFSSHTSHFLRPSYIPKRVLFFLQLQACVEPTLYTSVAVLLLFKYERTQNVQMANTYSP